MKKYWKFVKAKGSSAQKYFKDGNLLIGLAMTIAAVGLFFLGMLLELSSFILKKCWQRPVHATAGAIALAIALWIYYQLH